MPMDMNEPLYVARVNGQSLHYAVAGEGRPVVLVHGNGEDHRLFDTQIRQLTEAGFRVFAPDSRGHGANGTLGEYHYADMVEDMYQFIRAMGLERPALYGHSDGGIIGLMLEIAHPGTLGRLAVSGTNLSPEGLIPSFLAECAEMNAHAPNPLTTLMLTEPHIAPEALEQLALPVLVTVGEHDLVRREEALRIAAALPDAHLVIVDGADHGSYIEGSGVMGGMLLPFLNGEGERGITVKAATGYLETVTAYVDAELEKLGCGLKARMQIDVALDEIFSNIANYAYPGGDGSLTVRCEGAGEMAGVTFTDRGVPYNPLERKDPDLTRPAGEREIGGLGIYLVKKTMDGVAYRYEAGRNVLTIRKRIRG